MSQLSYELQYILISQETLDLQTISLYTKLSYMGRVGQSWSCGLRLRPHTKSAQPLQEWLFPNINSRFFGAVAASLSWVKGAGAELAAMPPALGQGWRGGPRPPHPHNPGSC